MGTLQRQTTLSKQTSAVFNLTLDQLQQSVGSGKPFGSMNMVRPDGPRMLPCGHACILSNMNRRTSVQYEGPMAQRKWGSAMLYEGGFPLAGGWPVCGRCFAIFTQAEQ